MRRISSLTLLFIGCVFLMRGVAQTGPLAALTDGQRSIFAHAMEQWRAGQAGDAVPAMLDMAETLPESNAAYLYIWQTVALLEENGGRLQDSQAIWKRLAEKYPKSSEIAWGQMMAAQKAGDRTLRDRELDRIGELKRTHADPKLENVVKLEIEMIPVVDGRLTFEISIEPWGRHKTYLQGFYTKSGEKEASYVYAVESDDMDQVFAKGLKKGERRFSYDGYVLYKPNADGSMPYSHATYGFYDGPFVYETMRDHIVDLVKQKTTAVSSTEKKH